VIGLNDGQLLMYDIDHHEMEFLKQTKVTDEQIKQIDWSIDDHVLRVQTHKNDILYYDISSKQVLSNAPTSKWSSNRCTNIEKLKGLHRHETTVCALNNNLLAFATNNLLCLSTFPYTNNLVPFYSTLHCCHGNLSVEFSCKGKFIYVSDTTTCCFWQWKVV